MSNAFVITLKAGKYVRDNSHHNPKPNVDMAIAAGVLTFALSIAFLALLIIPRAIGTVIKPFSDGARMAQGFIVLGRDKINC